MATNKGKGKSKLPTPKQIKEYLGICDELGISALVEAHDENEVRMAVECNARLVGVNNRNLKDFSVDTDNSRRMRAPVPEGILFVSESGVKDEHDILNIRNSGADAVLVGEALMRATDKTKQLKQLKSLL